MINEAFLKGLREKTTKRIKNIGKYQEIHFFESVKIIELSVRAWHQKT